MHRAEKGMTEKIMICEKRRLFARERYSFFSFRGRRKGSRTSYASCYVLYVVKRRSKRRFSVTREGRAIQLLYQRRPVSIVKTAIPLIRKCLEGNLAPAKRFLRRPADRYEIPGSDRNQTEPSNFTTASFAQGCV